MTFIRPLQFLTFNYQPAGNGLLFPMGFNVRTDTAYALSNAAPLTVADDFNHGHCVIQAESVVGAPFDLTITGESINEATDVVTSSDTEVISITGNGFYQSQKTWLEKPVLSVPAGKTLSINVNRVSYFDLANQDFKLIGSRLEFFPNVSTWGVTLTINKINSEGSLSLIDEKTMTDASSPVRGTLNEPGDYKRLDYNTDINGNDSEGLVISINQTAQRYVNLILIVRAK